jgi:hypothetical protein
MSTSGRRRLLLLRRRSVKELCCPPLCWLQALQLKTGSGDALRHATYVAARRVVLQLPRLSRERSGTRALQAWLRPNSTDDTRVKTSCVRRNAMPKR